MRRYPGGFSNFAFCKWVTLYRYAGVVRVSLVHYNTVAGLYKLTHKLERAWFQPSNLKRDPLV
jgi:selenocysteine lyase/cysteine desulfurase